MMNNIIVWHCFYKNIPRLYIQIALYKEMKLIINIIAKRA